MNTIILIMNRAVESGVSFEKAYFIAIGDNVDLSMVHKIANNENSSQKLRARAWRLLAKHDSIDKLSWLVVQA